MKNQSKWFTDPEVKRKQDDHRRSMMALIKRWKRMKGCSVCLDETVDPDRLHIDHIDPADKGTRYNEAAIRWNWRKPRVKKELAKCQVLCHSCHAEKTAKERRQGLHNSRTV